MANEQLQNLSPEQEKALKAFQTGYQTNPDTQVDAAALRREALSDQITMLTYERKDLTLWKDLNETRQPATSTVEQYIVYDSHGEVGSTRFTPEIGLADENDPTLRQKTVKMKFMSDTRTLSFATQLVGNVADPERIEQNAALVVVAKSIEWASFYGDSSLRSPGIEEGYEFDGLATLIPKGNVIDRRGKELREKDLNRAAVIIGQGYGEPTDAYMPISVHAAFNTRLLDRQRTMMVQNNGDMTTGFAVTQFYSARGLINLHGSVVMDLDNRLSQTVIPRTGNAPQQPKLKATRKENQGGRFRNVDLQAQSYKVIVATAKSKSIPSEEANVTVSANTDGVELEIQLAPLYGQLPTYVSVYRQDKDGDQDFHLLQRISASEIDEDNKIVFVDKNETIPGTADVFVGQMHPDVIHLFELLPMLRLDLAQVTSAKKFSVLWYGALALRAPKRWVRIKNVASLDNFNDDDEDEE